MKNFLKIFAIIALVSIFFEGFVLCIGPVRLLLYKIFVPLSLLFYVICNRHLVRQIVLMYKKTPFKYLVWFIAWLFIDALILVLLGRAKLLIFYSIAWKLLPVILEIFLLTALFIPKVITVKNFIKIFTVINYLIFIFAFIELIGSCFSITLISKIVDTVSNLKQVAFDQGEMIDYISGSHRVRSIFHEPGSLAGYIFFVMPIFYSLILSKYKVFKNAIINKIVKISFIPLMWLTLICTQSPIFLVFSVISTICYFSKSIITNLKKYLLQAVILVFAFLFVIVAIVFLRDYLQFLEGTYIARIINVADSLRNIDDIIEKEPSLGFRIVSFVNALRAYVKYPILGYGYDNLRYYIEPYLLNSPVALTRENILAMTLYYKPGAGVSIYHSNITRLLAETGIIGTILFYFYMFKNITFVNKIKKYYKGIYFDFCSGINFFLYCSIFSSFYVYILGKFYVLLILGIICAMGITIYSNKI